jgi:hypothetical protein
MPRHNTPLGVSPAWWEVIRQYVAYSKGRLTGPDHAWFYGYLVNRTPRYSSSIYEVIDTLRQAWWVEEEDVEQFILSILFRIGILYRCHPRKFTKIAIALQVRDYLAKNAFDPVRNERVDYKDESVSYDYSLFLDIQKLPVEDKYAIALRNQGLQEHEICTRLVLSHKKYFYDTIDLRERVRKEYVDV